MSAAHTRAVAPVSSSPLFGAFCERHGLPDAGLLPPRAAALALAAFDLAARYVGHSEPPRAMAAARRECEARRRVLLAHARAIAAGCAS